MTKEALKLALECLDGVWRGDYSGNAKEVITAIKEALANEALEKMAENARELGLDYEPAQEPVGEIVDAIEGAFKCSFTKMLPVGTKLYTTPPQRTWAGLTNDEVNNIAAGCHLGNSVQDAIFRAEQIIKEKNT